MLEAPRFEPFDRPLEHPPFEILLGALEGATVEEADESRATLPGQAVHRDVVDPEIENVVEIPLHLGE